MAMTLAQAKELLTAATREELRDHAFGDCEVYWKGAAGEEIASGYFGSDVDQVVVGVGVEGTEFEGADAKALRDLGKLGAVGRNDSTGPDEYREGDCMPALTRDGVLRELTEPDDDDDDERTQPDAPARGEV